VKYAIILGNLGNTNDRFLSSGYKDQPSKEEMIKRAAAIEGVEGVELVGTWDITSENVEQVGGLLSKYNLKCASIIPDHFAQKRWGSGAFSSKDPAIRAQAVEETAKMAEAARALGCDLLSLWPGQDGYDYPLQADYRQERQWIEEGVRGLARSYPQTRFALEYKAKEPRTHSTLARVADTLLTVQETGRANVGVTIDTGHAYVAGEVVGESIVLAKRAGNKLIHMHFNDKNASWDDATIVGAVHSIAYIETLYWLDRTGYTGWLSMDQYPYREDGAAAIGESILWLNRFDEIMQPQRAEIDRLIALDDAIETSRFLRKAMLGA